jgi:hypothetical protein
MRRCATRNHRRDFAARSTLRKRLRAPGAKRPELMKDAPSTSAATIGHIIDAPFLPHFAATPRTVTHERHQNLALARRIRTTALIAAIGVFSPRHFFLPRTITPRAVMPIELHPAPATIALQRELGRLFLHRPALAAPGTSDHRLGNRALAAHARVMCFEQFRVFSHELLATNGLPIAASWVFIMRRAAKLRGGESNRPCSQPAKRHEHLGGVPIAMLRM